MTTIANGIPERQNTDPAIQLQSAAKTLYRGAERLFYLQLVFGVAVPVLFATANLVLPEFSIGRPRRESIAGWFALYGFVMILVDEFLIDAAQRGSKKKAATAQEMFDVEVFQLPWNTTKVPNRLNPSDIADLAASSLTAKGSAVLLRDWYAPVVGKVPIEIGRIICQRTNLWWDSKLRRWYAFALFAFAVVLVVLALGVAKAFVLNVDGLLIGLMTVGPALRWAIREGKRHRSLADTLDRLCSRANQLVEMALENRVATGEQKQASRELQDAIYDHRSSAPIGINWIYLRLRAKFESGMRINAEDVVRDYAARQRQ